MELQTISQVSLDYGISRRMLCYYEDTGLLTSNRKDDYAYRVYDENAIKRLQQIIILRKLQIPIKQIKEILNNQDAVTAIEIFKQNISELDENITALSAVKSILVRFVEELQEKTDLHLKLDLLNDKTMISLVDALSIPISRVKEKISMDELNKANEQLNKLNDEKVRIIYRPPATMASIRYLGGDSKSDKKARKDAEAVMENYFKEVDLFRIKPDVRVIGFGGGNGNGGWEMWATIPDDLDVPAPLTKISYNGGLYAVTAAGLDFLNQWVQDSNKYDWCPHSPGGEEYINPFNIYGLKNIESEAGGSMYNEYMIPVKELVRYTDEQIGQVNATVVDMEKSNRHEPVDIDLTTLERHGEFELAYTDGLMTMRAEGRFDVAFMATPQQFDLPLKIELRAKTNNTDIDIDFAKGWISYNHHQARNKWFIMDILHGTVNSYKLNKKASVNEFVDIEWILGKKLMVIKLNGEIQHFGSDYGYIDMFKENPDFNLPSTIRIGTTGGSTLTVERLRITEL